MAIENLLGSALGPIIDRALSALMKPSNLKARLSVIEAYSVYYPVYRAAVLLNGNVELFRNLIKSLKQDPIMLNIAALMIGHVSSIVSTQDKKEDIKTATNLLYVPTPIIEELRRSKELLDFLDQIMKLLDSGKTDSMNEIMKLAKDRFQAKYQEGDVQILSGETLMDEALVVLLTLLMLGAQINWLIVKIIIVNYYRILLDERAVSDIPAFISYLAMIFGAPDTNPEAMQKLKEFFPENKVRTIP